MWFQTVCERLACRMEREPKKNGLWVWALRFLMAVALWASVSVIFASLLG